MKDSIPKNRILLRGAALALALCLLFSCAACGKKNTTTALRADLSGRVYTLDPQYCSTALERCLLKNCMEGLLRRLPDGTMAEGCAGKLQRQCRWPALYFHPAGKSPVE